MDASDILYVGCYTGGSPVGIHVVDLADGAFTKVGEVIGIDSPSFLAAHPGGSMVYAVSETSNGRGDGGSVFALRVNADDGSLTHVQKVASGGDAPCHLSVAADGSHLYVANYVSGSIASFALDADGSIGPLVALARHQGSGPTSRQEGPHAHCVVPHRYLSGFLAVDLGIDRVIHYSDDGRLNHELRLPPGTGPRHLAWHPHDPVCFVVGELNNTVTTVECDPESGQLTPTGTWSTLPDGYDGPSLGAEVAVHPDGSKVYVSNRGHNSIAVFDYRSGQLEPRAHAPSEGDTPRHFALSPSADSMVVANQDSNTLRRFTIEPSTGVPAPTGPEYEVSRPVCVLFAEVGS